MEPNLGDDDLRLFFTMFDTGTTILEGIVEDGLIERGFDDVNDEDLRAWLRRHGARQITRGPGPVRPRALRHGVRLPGRRRQDSPNMAAGTAVHDLLRIFFTYREAFAWKMQAGMGDTVFTPFYEVLKKRGVTVRVLPPRLEAGALARPQLGRHDRRHPPGAAQG